MKTACLAACLVFPGLLASDWTPADTKRQAIIIGLSAIDWAQTRQISDSRCVYYETNPFLGRKPSPGRVNRWFIGSVIVHAGIAMALPPKWRARFQYVSIGYETAFVTHNYKLGIRIPF